ncbi:MAG: hypothetical protein IKU13_04210, partial [Clostridia bacterium]|nr:hypothetical protein [Clostridia bacterium]
YVVFIMVFTFAFTVFPNWREDVPIISIIGRSMVVGGIALIFLLGRKKSNGIGMINMMSTRNQMYITNMQLNAYTNDVKKANEVFGPVKTERTFIAGYEKLDYWLPFIIGGISIAIGLILYQMK